MYIIDANKIAQNNKDPDNYVILILSILAFVYYFFFIHR